jgi:hypothetical protein
MFHENGKACCESALFVPEANCACLLTLKADTGLQDRLAMRWGCEGPVTSPLIQIYAALVLDSDEAWRSRFQYSWLTNHKAATVYDPCAPGEG